MIRVETLNLPYNFCLAGPIDVTDIIVTRFAVDRNGVDVPELAAHDITGCVGGLDSYI